MTFSKGTNGECFCYSPIPLNGKHFFKIILSKEIENRVLLENLHATSLIFPKAQNYCYLKINVLKNSVWYSGITHFCRQNCRLPDRAIRRDSLFKILGLWLIDKSEILI